MKKIIKIIYNNIPFKLKFWIDKIIRKKIEEVEVVYNLLKHKKDGVMIDVGAHFGTTLEPFMNLGWAIHAFEPDPNNRQKLLALVKDKQNVSVNIEAVSNVSGLDLSFYSSEISTGISGLSNFHSSHEEIGKVKTKTLKDYVKENNIENIDFLKIDTEGHDLFVLKGFEWAKDSHPKIIICEFEDKKTESLGYNTQDIIDFMIGLGYNVIVSEWYPIIEYGKGHKWKRFVSSLNYIPTENAWGNIIASKEDLSKSYYFKSI